MKDTSEPKSSGSLTVTETVAEFVASVNYHDIPELAITLAKKALLDWLGVAIAGSREPGTKLIAEYARKAETCHQASAICQGFKTTAELAALVNGTASHAIDFDDTFPDIVHYNIHPSVCLFPAVLALAEKHRLSGQQVLKAYIIGLEVIYLIGSAIGEISSKNGWHPTPVIGTMGAAAASASVINLSRVQTQPALGIAASLSGGFLKNFGSMTKPLHAGNAARNGVIAAELAASGFTANGHIFDEENNFSRMFGYKLINGLMDAENDLGKIWKTASIGLVFKPYPSCRSTHSSIDATLYLRNQHNIKADQVAGITCRISPMHTRMASFHKPETGYQGKFSIPYCIATALINGKISLDDFTDEKVKALEANKLLSKVAFQYPEGEPVLTMDLKAEITITLKNGDSYSHQIDLPRGEPENPLSEEELIRKFQSCAGLKLNQANIQKMLYIVQHLEEAPDLSRFFEILDGAGKVA
jgi:2-methylcitrate dehydratase PrpD